MRNGMAIFSKYLGIDYSGADTGGGPQKLDNNYWPLSHIAERSGTSVTQWRDYSKSMLFGGAERVSMDSQDALKRIAEIILAELENIDCNLDLTKPGSPDVFAYPPQPISGGSAGQKTLDRIRSALYLEKIGLKKDPFIAYAKATVDGKQKTYFFTRNYTPSADISPSQENVHFVNYKSPMGRIVEMQVNDDEIIDVPEGEKEVSLLEKDLFKSFREKNQWDAIQNSIFTEDGTFTIPSLLEFLRQLKTIPGEIDWGLRSDIQERERIIRQKAEEKFRGLLGLQRQVIEKMELRDQPVLDERQGAIFRLPLSSQIIITGAPGTGKTTTLIKRIAQKINPAFLELEDISKIPPENVEEYIHSDNWVMFTPTELLKIYIKEAFNKESVAASDRLVKVWSDERDKIARESLRILKTGDKGYFRKARNKIFPVEKNSWLINYSLSFIEFHIRYLFDLFSKARQILNENAMSGEMITRFEQIDDVLKERSIKDQDERAFTLIQELKNSRDLFNRMNQELKNDIEKVVFEIMQKSADSFNELFEITEAHRLERVEESDLDEDFSDEDEEFEPETEEKAIIVKRQLTRTLRYLAQRRARGQSVSKKSVHWTVLGVIKPYFPDKDKVVMLGKRIIDMNVSNVLTRGYTNLLSRMPHYYQRFRIDLLKQGISWVGNEFKRAVKEKRICENEIDLLVFSILRNARRIFDNEPELLDVNSRVEILEAIKNIYAIQVVVDEATDFSTIQLGCMYNLSHPKFTSVTFSGDLMQRVTDFGLNRWEECKIISPSIKIHKIDKVYRQSPKLLKIAEVLYENNVGEKAPFRSAYPERVKEPEPLKFDTTTGVDVGQWVTDRILEIYQIHGGKLPSTAIFVAQDDQIPAALEAIQESLDENSISIKGCPRGEILGSEGKVRIFSIKYIKGLEFESVFFLDINKIASSDPQLFDKYIYVGLTRAASFMGVTYEGKFPHKIKKIESYFLDSSWQSLANA